MRISRFTRQAFRNLKIMKTKTTGKLVTRKSVAGSKENVLKGGSLCPDFHRFSENETSVVQSRLLEWYDLNKRSLPWRDRDEEDINQKAYGVWVSEIMLQQTQVATVIDYYNKWIKKWPTLQDLAKAELEEVNEMWSGLGYYSRGRRLHEGAQKVVSELQGEMPSTCTDLQRELPGVGRYTAGAIASIAFGQRTGVVDGNVIRVLARLRMIGAEATMDTFWREANRLADCERPGDLNQALMELGATKCTPKTPQCHSCPLKTVCKANAKVEQEKAENSSRLMNMSGEAAEIQDIECLLENCGYCLPADDPWNKSLGVQNFPRKAKKKPPREQTASVFVVCKVCEGSQPHYLLLQRPQKGLLAGLWEFPSSDEENGSKEFGQEEVVNRLQSNHGLALSSIESHKDLGEVVHIFSHIHQTYVVSMVTVLADSVELDTDRPSRWLSEEEMEEAALPTAMRKVFKLCGNQKPVKKGLKRKLEEQSTKGGKQRSIASFFKLKN